jgi:murein L,D-transpeptidase YcbB/YkuD
LALPLVLIVSTCGSNAPTRTVTSVNDGSLARSEAAPSAAGGRVADAIRKAIADRATDARTGTLDRLYRAADYAPIWTDAVGRPGRDAIEALVLLRNVSADGLKPGDYSFQELDRAASALRAIAAPSPSSVASFDVGLSVSVLRYFRELHSGRVDPRTIGFRINTPADDHDYVSLLQSALSTHAIASAADGLAPPLVLYRALRRMLARYRGLAADPDLNSFQLSAVVVRPGDVYLDAEQLRKRLIALGDLPATSVRTGAPQVYEGALVEAVSHFQMRHGLSVDGILGPETRAALIVPLSWRVRQIELALERLRWLPHLDPDRFLAVNIPMFHLWVWDSIPPDGAPSFGMEVIVGRALHTRTPVLVKELRQIVFRPYWNVPTSIARSELVPLLQRDASYLDRHAMEIVAGAGDDAKVIPPTPEALRQLASGRLRIRQRPGPSNALGLVKFVFPNDEHVYMHGTPATELFGRSRRDFSHGCVRVADPVALAEWALTGQGWTREAILAAMNGSAPRQVELARPIQVILFYVTAVVMPEDGTVRFADDIYRHDRTLNDALQRRTHSGRVLRTPGS